MVILGSVGGSVDVQLRPSIVVKLQPSVLSGRGRVIEGGGGYMMDPMVTQNDATNPDNRPDKPPCRKTTNKI